MDQILLQEFPESNIFRTCQCLLYLHNIKVIIIITHTEINFIKTIANRKYTHAHKKKMRKINAVDTT